MADYSVLETPNGTMIKRMSDGAVIPIDAANRDYQAYLDFIGTGNTAAQAPVSVLFADNTFADDPWQTMTTQKGLPT